MLLAGYGLLLAGYGLLPVTGICCRFEGGEARVTKINSCLYILDIFDSGLGFGRTGPGQIQK